MVTKCQKHISGPLLDRVDIHIEVPRVDYQRLSSDRLGASSEAIQARVEAADWMQRNRFGERKIGRSMHAITCKADMHVGEIRSNSKSETGLWGQWWEFQPFLHEEKEIVPSVKNEIAC